MDKENYKQALQAFSSRINDLMNDIEEFRKVCHADKKYYWVTDLDFVLHDLDSADTELCISIQEIEEDGNK
ncbi:hypothetical protein RASY3_14730 [Ruminococcus albus SY3]|uniref:Uncharacterized protein n=1 Tax=Ruminococcus albus SY3 TaxID=1341156 RepID=A0A011UZF8_RUMAL|nr:hypothetical protein [Ruminococcus albus]EXM38562.1 hypothetical protein RASY3_14730 [Ruminococcus albus SY3]